MCACHTGEGRRSGVWEWGWSGQYLSLRGRDLPCSRQSVLTSVGPLFPGPRRCGTHTRRHARHRGSCGFRQARCMQVATTACMCVCQSRRRAERRPRATPPGEHSHASASLHRVACSVMMITTRSSIPMCACGITANQGMQLPLLVFSSTPPPPAPFMLHALPGRTQRQAKLRGVGQAVAHSGLGRRTHMRCTHADPARP